MKKRFQTEPRPVRLHFFRAIHRIEPGDAFSSLGDCRCCHRRGCFEWPLAHRSWRLFTMSPRVRS